MSSVRFSKAPWVLAFAMSLSGCGASSNFNQIFGKDEDAADRMLEVAKAAYDRGDFEEAEKLTSSLLDRNPDNESAALVLGYTYLSMGGIDPYRLARELIALDTADKATASGSSTSGRTKLQQGGQTGASSDTDKSSDASSTLTQLGALINLDDADFAALSSGTFDAEKNGGVEPTLFADSNALILPAKVTDELRAKVDVLNYMNKAVRAVCRFVATEVKATTDTRDTDTACATTSAPRNSPAKAHFLWGFSHLTEALVYQTVLLYSGAKNGTSNFQNASTKLDTTTFSGASALDDFVTQVAEIKNATDAVFDTTSSDSMLVSTLNDFDSVTLAFDQIVGLPEGIKNRIVNASKKIKEVGATFGGTQENNADALKGQMTEKFVKTVGGKVDSAVEGQLAAVSKSTGQNIKTTKDLDKLPAEQKKPITDNIAKACSSYDKLSKGLPAEKVAASKPSNCATTK